MASPAGRRQVSESRGLRCPRMNAGGPQVSESRASVLLGWTLEDGRCQKVGPPSSSEERWRTAGVRKWSLRRPRMNAEGRQVSESRASVLLRWTLEHGRCQKVGPPFASKVDTKAPISKEMAPHFLTPGGACLRPMMYTIVHTGVRKVTPFIGWLPWLH